MLSERPLDILGCDALALVQPAKDSVDDFLGLVLPVILDEAVEKVFPRQRVADLSFLVVILELGKVDNLVFARVFGFAIDLEHHFIRLEQHSFERITIPSQQEGAWLKRNGTSGSNSVVESQPSESTVNVRHEDLAFAFGNRRRLRTRWCSSNPSALRLTLPVRGSVVTRADLVDFYDTKDPGHRSRVKWNQSTGLKPNGRFTRVPEASAIARSAGCEAGSRQEWDWTHSA